MIDQETLGAALAYTNKALEALKNVVHYLGVTTTTLSDGATTNPITINGRSVTAVDGDMVFYNGTAYTWNGTAWQETLSIAQIITQIEELQDAIGNLSNLDTTEKSNLVAAINEIVADIPTKLSDLADDVTHRLVTDTEKSAWDAKATTTDITNAINALDVSSVGGTGKYISAISEADGKISATEETMDDAPTENSNAPVKSGGIKTAIDDSVSLKTATGNPITLTDAAHATAEELLMTIEPIQSGSGDPSPTNVRPISGLTSGEVTRTGKNIVHIDSTKIYSTDKDPSDPITGIADGMLILSTATNGYIRGVHVASYTINNANSITVKMADTAGSGVYGVGIVVEIDDTKTYTLNLTKTGGDATVGWLNSDGSSLSYTNKWNIPITLTPPSGAKYAMILCCPGRNAEHTFSDIQLEEGSTATPYEPYTAATATITFGQTVYGGSVNFKTGEVTVTHANIASYNGESINEPWLSSLDKYESGATPTTGAQVVYPLSTPTILTLTPAELELLKGNNTITANGAEISIKYYPDNAIGTLAGRVDDLDNITSDMQTQITNRVEIQNNAAFHNSIYRGKFLGTEVTQEQWDAISAGTFDDMYIGDYWTIGGVNYRIAHFNYWFNCGDIATQETHVLIVPDTNLYNAKMNNSNVTTGAYVGSKMYTTNLAQAKTTINNAFGASHILNHREYLANAMKATADPTYESAGSWYDSTVELMNERMVYGADVFHNVEVNGAIPTNYTIDKSQLALFALDPSRICNRAYWWLRCAVSAASFALVDRLGSANYDGASNADGVRPAFGIKATDDGVEES